METLALILLWLFTPLMLYSGILIGTGKVKVEYNPLFVWFFYWPVKAENAPIKWKLVILWLSIKRMR